MLNRRPGSSVQPQTGIRLAACRYAIAVILAGFVGAGWAVSAQGVTEPNGPQAVLPEETLVIVGVHGVRHVFHVEVARTPQQQTTGLMFRKDVPPESGMLFVWGHPIESQMWMKNTLVPLDMVFIDAAGSVSRIVENTVPQSLAIIASRGPVVATLELRGGITSKLGIVVGDHVLCRALGTMP